jgi:NAD-dependent deacetylase sirtuin 2
MVPGSYTPTAAHYFFALLARKGILKRVLTQNIDGLERQAGTPPELVIECHGRFYTAHCLECGKSFEFDEYKDDLQAGKVLRCSCGGLVKPDLVFFGDALPPEFQAACRTDLQQADLLIVMGTSLLVQPFALIPEIVRQNVPRLLLNLTVAGQAQELLAFEDGKLVDVNTSGKPFKFGHFTNTRDLYEGGDVEVAVLKLVRLIGWESEFLELLPGTVKERVLKAADDQGQ